MAVKRESLRLNFTIDESLWSEIRRIAEDSGLTMSSITRFALSQDDLLKELYSRSAEPIIGSEERGRGAKRINLTIPVDLVEKLDQAAQELGESRSRVLRLLLNNKALVTKISGISNPSPNDNSDQLAKTPTSRSSTPPSVPAQTRSAHFTIRDGLVTTVPTQDIGPDENDYRRLAALQTPLLQASKNSQTELSKNNKPFAALLDVTENYLGELDKDVREINYAVLYAYGLQLAVAYESTEELIEKGELPDFDLDALTSTRTVLQLHGPFILSSKDGRDLVTDAERYERNPIEERQFQNDVKEFGEILRERDDLVEEKAGEFISDITAPDDGSEQFERRYLFTKGAAKNLVIVFSAGALVASTAFIPVVGPVVAASLGLLTVEAMKKSKPFNDLSAPIKRGLDDLSDVDLERLKQIPREQLEKMREFVLSNQDILRRVGGSAREMQWFRDVLEWVSSSDENAVQPAQIALPDPIGANFVREVLERAAPTTTGYNEKAATEFIVLGLTSMLQDQDFSSQNLVFDKIASQNEGRASNTIVHYLDTDDLSGRCDAVKDLYFMSKRDALREAITRYLIDIGSLPAVK